MKKQTKKELGTIRGGSMFTNQLLVLLIAFTVLIPGFALGFLIVYSHLLPTWVYILLTILWYGVVLWIGYVVYKRIDLRRERYLLGDEAFFRLHPREWKREIRRWKNVDSYRVVAQDFSQDELPALLQLGYQATKEEIARLGLALEQRDEISKAATQLLHDTPYDELYYRAYPQRLRCKLALLRMRRTVIEKLTSSSREPTLYERRLEEIKAIIERPESK